jgi:hypothetical protein
MTRDKKRARASSDSDGSAASEGEPVPLTPMYVGLDNDLEAPASTPLEAGGGSAAAASAAADPMLALMVAFAEKLPYDSDDDEADQPEKFVLSNHIVLVPTDAAAFVEALKKARHTWRDVSAKESCKIEDDPAQFALCDHALHTYLMALARAGTGSHTASCSWGVTIDGDAIHASFVMKTGVMSTASDLAAGPLAADVVYPFIKHVLDESTSSAYEDHSHAFVRDFLQYCKENDTLQTGVCAAGVVVSSAQVHVTVEWYEHL